MLFGLLVMLAGCAENPRSIVEQKFPNGEIQQIPDNTGYNFLVRNPNGDVYFMQASSSGPIHTNLMFHGMRQAELP